MQNNKSDARGCPHTGEVPTIPIRMGRLLPVKGVPTEMRDTLDLSNWYLP
jgi:hypothetical protein